MSQEIQVEEVIMLLGQKDIEIYALKKQLQAMAVKLAQFENVANTPAANS